MRFELFDFLQIHRLKSTKNQLIKNDRSIYYVFDSWNAVITASFTIVNHTWLTMFQNSKFAKPNDGVNAEKNMVNKNHGF